MFGATVILKLVFSVMTSQSGVHNGHPSSHVKIPYVPDRKLVQQIVDRYAA